LAPSSVNARRAHRIEIDTSSAGISLDGLLRAVATTLNDVFSTRRNQARILERAGASSADIALAGVELDAELIRLRAYIGALTHASASWVDSSWVDSSWVDTSLVNPSWGSEKSALADDESDSPGSFLPLLQEELA
jgi:hypothetical protein